MSDTKVQDSKLLKDMAKWAGGFFAFAFVFGYYCAVTY